MKCSVLVYSTMSKLFEKICLWSVLILCAATNESMYGKHCTGLAHAPVRNARSKGSKVAFSKGKPVSSWLILNSSDMLLDKSSFCASNSWPAFCFAYRCTDTEFLCRYDSRLFRMISADTNSCASSNLTVSFVQVHGLRCSKNVCSMHKVHDADPPHSAAGVKTKACFGRPHYVIHQEGSRTAPILCTTAHLDSSPNNCNAHV